jgi:hypothetical protein
MSQHRSVRFALALTLAFVPAHAAAAFPSPGPRRGGQERAAPCPDIYPEPKVGHYADVRFTNADGESMVIRFAVVGAEEVAGQTHYWIEVVSAPPSVGGVVIVKMLVPYYPFENEDIKGYVVKMPGQPALRVPQEMLEAVVAQSSPGPGWTERCASAVYVGTEQVTVAAGTFTARRYRATDGESGEVWIADVPFGMVKLVQADGVMELLDFGDDAKPSITEEPVEMKMPPPGQR